MNTIPVIDIAPFRLGDLEARHKVVDQVRDACERVGFFTILGHGIPKSTVDNTYKLAEEFFALPDEEKSKVAKGSGASYKGYGGVRQRTLGADRDQLLKPSLQESFAMGFVDVTDDPYFKDPRSGTHYEPNIFPARPVGFQDAAVDYYHHMEALSRVIMRIFAHALDVEESYFLRQLERHISVLRFVHYPSLTEAPQHGEERSGAHSDSGAVTILKTNDPIGSSALQVKTAEDRWIDVIAPPDAFVINIGDILMRWTNDRFLSTMHRVVNPPIVDGKSRSRISIPYFCQPAYEAVIECIESCATADRPSRYPPITGTEMLSGRYEHIYGLKATS